MPDDEETEICYRCNKKEVEDNYDERNLCEHCKFLEDDEDE
jgi:hypothetical protein